MLVPIYELLNAQVRLGMITLKERDDILAEMNALLDEDRDSGEIRGRAFLARDPRSRLQND